MFKQRTLDAHYERRFALKSIKADSEEERIERLDALPNDPLNWRKRVLGMRN